MKAFAHHFTDGGIGAGSEFEPDHGFVTALPHLFLDSLAQFGIRIVIEFDFGIARHADQGGSRQHHSAVEFVRIAAHDFVERDEKLLAGVHPTG